MSYPLNERQKELVPRAGIEPARLLEREILSLLCLPISPPRHLFRYVCIIPSLVRCVK